MKREQIQRIKERYIGKLVFVHIDDPYHPIAERGVVESVDDMGQLHGTWGGLAALPEEVEIL